MVSHISQQTLVIDKIDRYSTMI